MALKAIVDDVSGVPEPVRDFYVEQDGKFVLQVEAVNGYALENIEGLKTTFSKEMTKRKELEKTLQKYKDIDPDRAREALSKLEEIGNLDPSKEADRIAAERLEVAKRQLIERHAAELSEKDNRLGKLSKNIENLLIDQAATQALAEAKGSVELLLPHVQRHTRVRETENGNYVVEVIDKDGNARIANSKGDPMTISDLVQEMRRSASFGRAFEGSGQSGSGTPPANGSGGSPQIKSKADLYRNVTTKEQARQVRSAWVAANGGSYAAYDKLPGQEPTFK